MFRDRMPQQLLAYLRLARLQDANLLAKARHAFGRWSVRRVCVPCLTSGMRGLRKPTRPNVTRYNLPKQESAKPLACRQVSFEEDVMLSAANEYEVLQLLLGECRERLAAYAGAQDPSPVSVSIFLLHFLPLPVF